MYLSACGKYLETTKKRFRWTLSKLKSKVSTYNKPFSTNEFFLSREFSSIESTVAAVTLFWLRRESRVVVHLSLYNACHGTSVCMLLPHQAIHSVLCCHTLLGAQCLLLCEETPTFSPTAPCANHRIVCLSWCAPSVHCCSLIDIFKV